MDVILEAGIDGAGGRVFGGFWFPELGTVVALTVVADIDEDEGSVITRGCTGPESCVTFDTTDCDGVVEVITQPSRSRGRFVLPKFIVVVMVVVGLDVDMVTAFIVITI